MEWRSGLSEVLDVRVKKLVESYTPIEPLEVLESLLDKTPLLQTRKNWKLESGIDLSYQYNYSGTETKSRRLVPNYSKYSGGVYSVFQYKFTPKINVETAIRYDFSQFDVKKWFDESDWNGNYAADFPEFYVKLIAAAFGFESRYYSFNVGSEGLIIEAVAPLCVGITVILIKFPSRL